jgi:hypothetical protein
MPTPRLPATPRLALVLASALAVACGSSVTTAPDGDDDDDASGTDTTGPGPGSGPGQGGGPSGPTVVASSSSGLGGEGGDPQSSSSSGGGQAPPFRHEVDWPDDELALRALQIIGADVEGAEDGCVPCHSHTEETLTSWAAMTNDALSSCLTDLSVSTPQVAYQMIECVRARSGIPGSKFTSRALGFWAAGAHKDWWRYTFEKADPVAGEAEWQTFVDQLGMPPNGEGTLSEGDYDVVAEWFVRGVPLLDELLDDEPQPGECDLFVDGFVADHVEEMATSGWRAVNASNGMLMHGCAGQDDPLDCLGGVPSADPSWLVPGRGRLLSLFTTSYESSYWTRGSASGRYVAHGAWDFEMSASIIDLQAGEVIPVLALYDPAFFPDDSGFVFQGGQGNVCSMSVLAGSPSVVEMDEPGCSWLGEVGLYQHVGAALGGGDYFAVSGPFMSDDGGHGPTTENPIASFAGNSSSYITPMIFDGQGFDAKQPVEVATPFEGDSVLSASARLLVSRVSGPGGRQNGFSMRRVVATPDGQGGYDIEVPEVARYCDNGGKPAFSYDERWMTLHHYVENTDADAQALGFASKDDPGFAPYRDEGAANVIVVDLLSGQSFRITDMGPGEYALFPYFRSDGWLQFIVREPGSGAETVVASDAVLLAEGG